MKSEFKTKEQIEFTDMAQELMGEPYKLTQNQIGELCRLSAPMVSMVLNGERNPGDSALELLRVTFRQITNPHHVPRPAKRDELKEQIDFLREHAPPSYEAAKAAVGALHKDAVERRVITHSKGKRKPANSAATSRLAKSSAEALARRGISGDAKSGQSSGVGEQPSHKDPPPDPSEPESKPPHSAHEGKDQT